MKRTSSLVLGLVFAVLIAVPQIVLGQTPVLPDYNQWPVSDSGGLDVTISGRNAKLSFTEYHFLDDQKHTDVNVLNNESQTPWLALYLVESRESSSSVSQLYLFEYQKNKWVLVKDLTANPAELPNVLKSLYGLEVN